MYCDKMGPWGAFHKTVELLKTARDEKWKLRYIFIVGCCGASVIEAKKKDFPRGTILLAEQVKDYLNTGKVEEECEEDIAKEMGVRTEHQRSKSRAVRPLTEWILHS